jgi:hypothetical protein
MQNSATSSANVVAEENPKNNTSKPRFGANQPLSPRLEFTTPFTAPLTSRTPLRATSWGQIIKTKSLTPSDMTLGCRSRPQRKSCRQYPDGLSAPSDVRPTLAERPDFSTSNMKREKRVGIEAIMQAEHPFSQRRPFLPQAHQAFFRASYK